MTPQPTELALQNFTLQGLRWGDEDKPLILALHGWLDNAASFSELAPLLQDYQVLALDMLGHGLSDHLPAGANFHFVDAVEIVIEVLDQLQQQDVVLLGHSLGGALATFIASAFPERVNKMILLDAIGPMSEESVVAPGRLRDAVLAFNSISEQEIRYYPSVDLMVKMRGKVNRVPSKKIQPLVERAVLKTAEGYTWRFDRKLSLPSLTYFTEEQVLAFLAAIQAPTLIVRASAGLLKNSEILDNRYAAFTQANVVEIVGPHHIRLTAADAVANEIVGFIG